MTKSKIMNPLRTAVRLALVGSLGISAAGQAAVLEEVVVTAQKRSENIQDIPFAISAFSQDSLDKAGISSLEEFAYKTPGLAISGESNGRTQINIRGISSGEVRRDNTRASETVGIYFDEIPLSTALYNPDLEAFDLERVEVLRGPQGTLYGSGSLAGTIRLVSQAPVIDEFEGLIDAGIDSVNDGDMGYSIKGMINLPISDVMAARIVGYTIEKGGWVDNVAGGPADGDDVNTVEKWGIRASLLWEASDRLSIRPTIIHQEIDGEGSSADNVEALGVQRLINVGTLTPAQSFDPSGEYEQWRYHEEPFADELDIFNLLVKYDFENFELVSSSSYTEREVRAVADISPNNLAGGLFPGAFGTNVLGIFLDDRKEIESFAQEIRVTSTHEGDLQWIGGVYYSDIDTHYSQPLRVTDPRGIVGLEFMYDNFGRPRGDLLWTEDDMTTEQLAVFGEVTYRFLEKFSAGIGLRWFDVEQEFTQLSQGFLNGNPPLLFTRKTEDDDINPKFIVSYEPNEDVLVSLQASRGFRLGGPQLFVPQVNLGPTQNCPGDLNALGVSFDPNGFDSENLWNYELAVKSTLMGGAVQFNASVFHIDYEDLQITTRLGCGFSFTDNAESAESQGFEFELQAQPTENLTVGFGGSYTDAQLTSNLSSGEGADGDDLIYVPKIKLNAYFDYTRPLNNNLEGYVTFNYQYTGKMDHFYPNATNLPVDSRREANAYDTGNLRVGVKAEDWQVAVFVNNLWDEYGVTYIDSINAGGPAGWVTNSTIRPRTVGLNVKYNF